jgi:hypothetical protein
MTDNDNRTKFENTTESGTTRVRETKDGRVFLDSYWGDVKDKDNHDRFTVEISSGDGKPSGHGFNHEPWDDKEKN